MTKYFITGATGFVGTAVTKELIKHGHKVVGLARSDKSADKLIKIGAEVLRGDLEDSEVLKKGARETDGVLHLGFIHDFENFERSCNVDSDATKAIISELEGSNKLFIYTSGAFVASTEIGVEALETDAPNLNGKGALAIRAHTEQYAVNAASKGIRSIAIRLPVVHGVGDPGFIPQVINIAKKNGVSYYVGEGKNTWPAVEKEDLAVLYRLAVEKGKAGDVYHASQEQGVEYKSIAEIVGKTFNLPVKSVSPENSGEKLGLLAILFAANAFPSTTKARALGWNPNNIGLLEDIEKNYQNIVN